jgi:hypothetical protein
MAATPLSLIDYLFHVSSGGEIVIGFEDMVGVRIIVHRFPYLSYWAKFPGWRQGNHGDVGDMRPQDGIVAGRGFRAN